MKIFKVINNNMVSVKNADGQEQLLKGLAIGYKKKPGDPVDESKIEKQFVLATKSLSRRFDEILVTLDRQIVEVCIDVIDEIKKSFKTPLSDALYITLIDHVNNLVDRLEQGIKFDNSVLWDLERIYPEEYALAQRAVEMLNERLEYQIDKEEASFITLHIVNAEMINNMNKTYKLTKYIDDICEIVISNLHVEFSENEYCFRRFVIHMKYMLNRIGRQEAIKVDSNNKILDSLIAEYEVAWITVEKITTYIEICMNYRLNREDQFYLMIHLVQIFCNASSDTEDREKTAQEKEDEG